MATREPLAEFKGMHNVTKVTSDNGQVSYLTESISLEAEANRVGAYDYAVFENATKHVFFLFSEAGESKYYLGQKNTDIAKDLGMNINTLNTRLSRGLKKLRKGLLKNPIFKLRAMKNRKP